MVASNCGLLSSITGDFSVSNFTDFLCFKFLQLVQLLQLTLPKGSQINEINVTEEMFTRK